MPWTAERLPFAGNYEASRHSSWTGAREASKNLAAKQGVYAQLLTNHGPMSDQTVAAVAGWPLSSVNSTRNSFGDQVVPKGHEPSPFGKAKRTLWGWA